MTQDIKEVMRQCGYGSLVKLLDSQEQRKFITIDPDTLKLRDRAIILSQKTTDPVLIIGETGTGKELIARLVHGSLNKNPFIGLNIGAMPEYLLESELFGHEKGAFTGAHIKREGLISIAGNGTLFLDEIGDMPPALQVKLLRVLQEKEYRPVGSDIFYPVKCRFISATNLVDIKNSPKFRKDLYYRLSAFVLKIKPLRERPNDIKEIVKHYSDKIPNELIKVWSTLEFLGNVRELQCMIKRYEIFGCYEQD